MKKIIALIISVIMASVVIYSKVDDLNTIVEVINAVSPAANGDFQPATTNVVSVGTYYAVGAIYFAIAMVFITTVIGVLKKI